MCPVFRRLKTSGTHAGGPAFDLHSRVIDGASSKCVGARPLQRSERGASGWRRVDAEHSPVIDAPCVPTSDDVGHPRLGTADGLRSARGVVIARLPRWETGRRTLEEEEG